jgi:hypothetical protein
VNGLDSTVPIYRALAQRHGFELVVADDVTRNTLPTHPVVARLSERLNPDVVAEVKDIELVMRLKLASYQVLAFRRL